MDHSLPYLANCSMLFTELPALQRPAAARDAGFDGVEFWWPFSSASPGDPEVDAFVAAVADAGVRLVALNVAAGDMPAGDRGLASWPGRSRELLDSVEVAVGIGSRLGTRAFNVLYGLRLDGVHPDAQDELALDNLAAAARAAAAIGAVVLVEPVSGAPRYPLRTAEQVVRVLDNVQQGGVTNVQMLADLYHLSVNGDNLDAVVAEHGARIGHVQVADAPGRHEPGTGTLDLDHSLLALQAGGYDGWVGLEYAPAAGTLDGLGWLPRERRGAPARTA